MRANEFDWILESFTEETSTVIRDMFGCRALYQHGRLMLVLAANHEPPWQGVLVATSREHHPSLQREFPDLAPHPVLGKWLYLPEETDGFERIIERLIAIVHADDTRLGVVGEPRRSAARPKKKPRVSSPVKSRNKNARSVRTRRS